MIQVRLLPSESEIDKFHKSILKGNKAVKIPSQVYDAIYEKVFPQLPEDMDVDIIDVLLNDDIGSKYFLGIVSELEGNLTQSFNIDGFITIANKGLFKKVEVMGSKSVPTFEFDYENGYDDYPVRIVKGHLETDSEKVRYPRIVYGTKQVPVVIGYKLERVQVRES